MMFLPELVCEKNKINVYFISDKGDLLIKKIDRNMRNFASFKYLLLKTLRLSPIVSYMSYLHFCPLLKPLNQFKRYLAGVILTYCISTKYVFCVDWKSNKATILSNLLVGNLIWPPL